MITNPHRHKQIKEFIDKDHKVMSEYYDLMEARPKLPILKKKMQSLIKRDPDFFDSYSVLADILLQEGKIKESDNLVIQAYERAVRRIADKKGNWPKVMEWGFLENRHLMRIIQRYGYLLWEQGKEEEALAVFRKLLRANPGDNQGARHSILAIRLGAGMDWDEPFLVKKGPMAGQAMDACKVSDWFDKNAKKFPDEFDWLFKE